MFAFSFHKVTRNIAANQLGFLVSLMVAMMLSPFVVHSLGDETYGIWSLIISFSGHYGLLSFGIQGAVTRYIAHSVAAKDTKKASGYMTAAFLCLILTAVLCIIIGILLTLWFPILFKVDPNSIPQIRQACFLVALTAAATFSFTIFQCNLYAHQRFGVMNLIGISTTLLRAGFTVFLLKSGYGLVGLASLGLGLTILSGVAEFFASNSFCSFAFIRLQQVEKAHFKDLLTYGARSFLIVISITLVYQSDLFVIGMFLSPERITIYSLAATLITYLIQFANSVSAAMNPYATECFATQGIKGVQDFFKKSGYLMYMLGGLIFAGCFVLGKAFFTLWIGAGYSESGLVLSILLIPQFFSIGFRTISVCLGATAQIGWLAIFSVCEGMLNLILSLCLVRSLGVYGVALGTLIPIILNHGLIGPWYAGKLLKLNLSQIYFYAMFPGIVICVLGILVGFGIQRILPPLTWAGFCVNMAVISFSCAWGGYWVFKTRQAKVLVK